MPFIGFGQSLAGGLFHYHHQKRCLSNTLISQQGKKSTYLEQA
jgi:hypothetical protein